MDREQAAQDLQLISRVLDSTRRRVDPQMFHLIIWGAIVLVWYPLMAWFQQAGNGKGQLVVGLVSVGLGMALSMWLGARASRQPRLPGSNTSLARQLGKIVAIFVSVGVVLSIAIPSLVHGGEWYVAHVWGLLYGLMLMTFGTFYSREVFWCGIPSLVATIVALRWPEHAGYILGPAMGLGCIVAGVIAERRVARLRRETLDAGDAGDADDSGAARARA